MSRERLIARAVNVLGDNGWSSCIYHGCFDIAARRRRLLFLKILSNVDALQPATATNLKTMSANMDAAALVIGENTSRERLADGVVYERFELPTLSIGTFEEFIVEGLTPTVFRDRGGLYVEIEPDLLRKARQKKGLTQAELADEVGISKKTVYSYERGRTRALLTIAERLEAVLNRSVTDRPDFTSPARMPTAPKDRLERIVGNVLAELGFNTDFVGQAPFDVFAREKALVLSDIENDRRAMMRRAPALKRFIATVREPALLITERSRDAELFGIPVVGRGELSEFGKPSELLRVAKRSA